MFKAKTNIKSSARHFIDPSDNTIQLVVFGQAASRSMSPKVHIHSREMSSVSNDLSSCMIVIECIISLTGCQVNSSMS